jgi:hypothetical protein
MNPNMIKTPKNFLMLAATMLVLGAFPGCESSGGGGTTTEYYGGVYYGAGMYDPWYYGPAYIPPAVIVTPPYRPHPTPLPAAPRPMPRR